MKRTKNELLQSCIEQFEHIDSVNNNPNLNTTESLIREIKKAINYTHCCTELRDEYLQPELDKYKNIKVEQTKGRSDM
jgi:hypothetical protein